MPNNLTKNTIKERLQKLRNLEMLHPRARRRIQLLEEQLRLLKEKNRILEELTARQASIIEKFKLRIEELERIVFGKRKKKKQDKKDKYSDKTNNSSRQKQPRDPSSYRRDIPKEEEITETKDYPITNCPDCGTPLEKLNLVVQYKEDIVLLNNFLKQIEKQRIQTGFCPHCKKRHSGLPIQPQTAYLGDNIKQFICYLMVILNLTIEKTKNLVKDLANIKVSDGEVSNILEKEAKRLLPQYHKLKANIRGQPASHYDETSWQVQQEEQGQYGWVMTGAETPDTVFRLGQSRGKGNAEKLQGKAKSQIGITDDYGAYRNLFQHHQLCWAHPLRKLRDLANSANLAEEKKKHCQKVYQSLSGLHYDLKEALLEPFELVEREKTKQKMLKRLKRLAQINQQDPAKLKTLKQGLLKNQEKYFTCLLHQAVPTTNNKAERALRHLVLKRKNSFGSKTQKGAWTMSVLYSVLLSLWWSRPKNFFAEYAKLHAYV